MPWIADEIDGWEDLSEEERERLRVMLEDLGLRFGECDEAEYFE